MKQKFINYFFDEEIQDHKLYTNLIYYSVVGVLTIGIILTVL